MGLVDGSGTQITIMRIDTPHKRSVITKLVRENPNLSTHMLARKLFTAWPDYFSNVESARTAVRVRRGANGDSCRRQTKAHAETFQDRREFKWEMPKSQAETWEPYILPDGEVLVLSDIHIPYHDEIALGAALDYGSKMNGGKGPDTILLNGDTADFFAISRFQKDPRQRNLAGEIQALRQFLGYIRQRFPKAKLIYKLGNHDERWEHWQWEKAPEYLDIPQMTMESILTSEIEQTEKFDYQPKIDGVIWVKDQRPIMAGALAILHGHEYPKGMTNSVNPARGNFLRGMESSLAGHLHRSSYHPEKTMFGRVIACWTTGCLCGMWPAYARINKWDASFATVTVKSGHEFTVNPLAIVKGKVYG